MKFKKLVKALYKGQRTLFAVLIDPDKFNPLLIRMANDVGVDCFLVGGSYLEKGNIESTVKVIKGISKIPIVLFPGDENQLTPLADGLFLPNLISGRNADFLIGKQVLMAPKIKKMSLKYLSMAYLLLAGEQTSTTQKITKTRPLALNNQQLIINTALAGEQLGLGLIYLEAGSGAKKNVPPSLIKRLKETITLPIIVGGGIDSIEKVKEYISVKTNMIVVGNALERNLNLIKEIGDCFEH
jgi:putative glycerol-1-phosphate prenyltransferase